ncbi:hypothetical protein QBC34DRAFT_383296 [Podospora aff. communis PSN243]|uniref:DUF7918 domain-containing protein n=1 Tax=Podospora aff. communis PSN243 TaxID=3040156 RepID=A0AAV9GGA3_9PEZI|nr:hypothetical protein QBC34DRAFT_383296 [Podospora aff. communis PSN243]
MAVLPGLEGLEVTIEVDGKTVQEYDPCDDSDGNPPEALKFHVPDAPHQADRKSHVVKYIESKPGVPFRFRIKRLPSFRHQSHHIAFRYHVDDMSSALCHDESVTTTDKNTTWEMMKDGFRLYRGKEEGWVDYNFYFKELVIDVDAEGTISSAESEQEVKRVKKLGVLRVGFWHMKYGAHIEYEPIQRDALHFATHVLSERIVKGKTIDTQASFKERKSSWQTPNTKIPDLYQNSLKRPFAMFEFRYRTMDGLMKGGIVPRPSPEHPSPERPSIKQLAQTMSEAEARPLAQGLGVLVLREARAAKAEDTENVKPGAKREREEDSLNDDAIGQRKKARPLESGNFEVDLTDD